MYAIRKAWQTLCLLRQWSRVLTLRDAFAVVFAGARERELQVSIRNISRKVTIRIGTSDLICVLKVFLVEEYTLPFDMSPNVIVDAGANIGMATLYFAQRYPDAKILAIEPEESNFALLKLNCSHLPNVTFLRAALWPIKRELAFANTNAEKWMFSVVEARGAGLQPNSVPSITMPEVMSQLGVSHLDLLKIDIEGAEKDLFSTAQEEWLGKIGMIVIELHDRFSDGCARAFYSAVSKHNFSQEVKGENIFVKISGGKSSEIV
jgi:FkbM family methyltransferase